MERNSINALIIKKKAQYRVQNGVRHQVINLLVLFPDFTYKEIGNIVGCSKQRVGEIAKEEGLTKGHQHHIRRDITMEKVLQFYYQGLLIKDIAKALGCSYFTVSERLREAGVSKYERYSTGRKLKRYKKPNQG